LPFAAPYQPKQGFSNQKRRSSMNTHNVKVKTAATETTETRVLGPNVNGLLSGVAQTLAFLGHLAEDGMEEGERAEVLLGSLLNLAEALRDAVPDCQPVAHACRFRWFGRGWQRVTLPCRSSVKSGRAHGNTP
jgi:hypothetical protein